MPAKQAKKLVVVRQATKDSTYEWFLFVDGSTSPSALIRVTYSTSGLGRYYVLTPNSGPTMLGVDEGIFRAGWWSRRPARDLLQQLARKLVPGALVKVSMEKG